MVWLLFILGIPVLVLCWLLCSTLEVELDTRVPEAGIRWKSIGGARIWYDAGWWLRVRVLFYTTTFRVADMKSRKRGRKIKTGHNSPAKGMRASRMFTRFFRVIKTFRVREWKLAIDTGDFTRNARLYPVNFMPGAVEHLFVNFNDENYLVLKIRNQPWKILYAFFR